MNIFIDVIFAKLLNIIAASLDFAVNYGTAL